MWANCVARPDFIPQRSLAFCRFEGVGALWTERSCRRKRLVSNQPVLQRTAGLSH